MFATLELGPMLKSVKRQSYRAILLTFQIAITMAVITNAIFIVSDRNQYVSRDSGADEANTFSFISEGFTRDFAAKASIENDLIHMRAMPGVVNAVQSESVPYNDSYMFTDLKLKPTPDANLSRVTYYRVDHFGADTFDIELIAGANFSPEQVVWQSPNDNSLPSSVLLSKATAVSLYGDTSWSQAVGQTIYYDIDKPIVVKGIYDKLHSSAITANAIENTILVPVIVLESVTRYVVRTQPGQLDDVIASVETELVELNPERKVRSIRPMSKQKKQAFANDYAIIKLLGTVVVIVTLVTAIGIAGLVSLNVSNRRRQIGIRRALGASQQAVVRYHLIENFILSVVGVSIGAILTLLLNMLLVQHYGLAPIEFYYVAAGMLTILVISQIAAFWPAAKAAKVPPAIATRNI